MFIYAYKINVNVFVEFNNNYKFRIVFQSELN